MTTRTGPTTFINVASQLMGIRKRRRAVYDAPLAKADLPTQGHLMSGPKRPSLLLLLPTELVKHILGLCGARELVRLELVCRELNALVEAEDLWAGCFYREFGSVQQWIQERLYYCSELLADGRRKRDFLEFAAVWPTRVREQTGCIIIRVDGSWYDVTELTHPGGALTCNSERIVASAGQDASDYLEYLMCTTPTHARTLLRGLRVRTLDAAVAVL
jgi:hypothetical protein